MTDSSSNFASNSDRHDDLVWLDRLCDRFEADWGTERQFSIERVLTEIPSEKRGAAFRALLELEYELRQRSGESPTPEELHQRFPEWTSTIDEFLENPRAQDSLADRGSSGDEPTLPPGRSNDDDDPDGDEPGSMSGPLRIPRRLGRYRIIRKLGQGAMGSVFLAQDEQLNRPVALKIPRANLQRNAEERRRFEREAQAGAAPNHRNICPIYDIGQVDGIHYICMAYIDGFSLSRYAVAESGLSEQSIAELVLKLAQALEVAHKAGFIHRDLKPGNIMVDHENEPVILDFGLARRVDPQDDIRLTQTGTVVGSPAYMSPEQADGHNEKIGVRSDVYSLGVILYELLTGRPPFEGSLASVLGQIMTREPAKPSDYRRDLSVRLETICLKMMAKDPDRRQATMKIVANELQEYLAKFASDPLTNDGDPNSSGSSAEGSPDRGTQRKQQIEQLIRTGDYAQAEKQLVALSRDTDDAVHEAALWAAAELPKLRKIREEVRAGRQEIYNTASRLMKAHDYEQAARLLEEYPYDLRTPKMQQLLEDADRLVHEVEHLRSEIKALRNQGDNRELLILLNALLELKPADRRAKDLKEQLTKKNTGPITKILGKRTPKSIKDMAAGAQWMLVFVLGLGVCSYAAYQWSSEFLSDTTGAMPVIGGAGGTAGTNSNVVDGELTGEVIDQPVLTDGAIPFPHDAAFVNARPLANLNRFAPINAYPSVSADGLTIWWTREGDGTTAGIYQASRSSVSEQFGGENLVQSNARLATVGADGLEMYALTANEDGEMTRPARFTRRQVSETFGFQEAVQSLSTFHSPKCFSLSEDGKRFSFQHRPTASSSYKLSVQSRAITADQWGPPEEVSTATPRLLRWTQFLDNGRLLLCSESAAGGGKEHVVIHSNPTQGFTFLSSRTVSIDGRTDQNIRCPKYCPATGELFYSLMTGPDDAPGSKGELWVAEAPGRASTNLTDAPTESAGEWIDLFNGRDLTGWKVTGKDPDWTAGNGVVSGRSGSGWLVSDLDFSDFELSLEYELQYGTQSGVLLRGPRDQDFKGGENLEIQLLHNRAPGFATVADNKKHGSLWGIVAARPVMDVLPNQWHRLTATAMGSRVTVKLNGQQVLDTDLASISGLRTSQPNAFRKSGAIALQLSDTPVSFRNIRIRRLDKNGKVSASGPSGALLEQLQGHWTVTSEITPAGPNSPAQLAARDKQMWITGDRFRITYNAVGNRADINDEQGTIVVIPNTNPLQVDLKYKTKSGKDDSYRGIMQITGNELRHRFVKSSMSNATRPTSFAGGVSQGWENIYEREAADASRIDLIAMLNPQRDFLDKTFKVSNGKLLTPPREKGDLTNSLLVFPLRPVPDAYDVHLVVERHSDVGYGCNFGVVMGGRQVTVDMDGSGNIAAGKPRKWALGYIDGFSMHDSGNPTVVPGNRFHRGRKVSVDIQVRPNNIRILVDGEKIIDWTGRPEQLSVWDAIEPRLTRKDSLYFFSQAAFMIHEMTLTRR
ncbi:MAG: family 16 glycoside hydrolase [Planctomycetaceae bacterium]